MKASFFSNLFRIGILAAMLSTVAAGAEPPSNGQVITTQRVAPGDYQAYVRNWDEKTYPVLLACIQSVAQWNAVMAPAAVMGKHAPFSPKEDQFARNHLLLLAQVMPGGSDDIAKRFKVGSAVLKDGELTLNVTMTMPSNKVNYTIKNYLGVWVPKMLVNKVVFMENGKRIGALEVGRGQWSIPKIKAGKS